MKTKFLLYLLSVSFCLITWSCTTENEINEINFTSIGQSNLYGNGRETISKQNFTISNSSSWNELLTKMNSVNNNSDGFTETNIDFENFMVIAVFDKIYGNGGHSIDIIKITEYERKIVVTIDNVQKGGLTSVMTQPYHIVKISRTNKPIFFK